MKAGLTAVEVAAPNVTQMAEALLNIGLENNCRSFLISCIKVSTLLTVAIDVNFL